jgi:hypothetical protein
MKFMQTPETKLRRMCDLLLPCLLSGQVNLGEN